MTPLGIGIIGTGSIVNTYIKCIEELEGCELIALCTTSSVRAQEAENVFGVPVFDDLHEFLKNPKIDLVCVCNKSGLHGEATINAARAGKHVLCEKPLEVSTEKIDEIIQVCKDNNAILGCVFQNRCGSDYKAVEEVLEKGLLGKLLLANAHINWYRSKEYYTNNPWRGTLQFDGGAALMNQGIHTIDLLLNLMGAVKSVFGNMKTLIHDIEGEDLGAGILNFENGATGMISASTALFPGHPERLEIYGEKGSILMEAGKIVQWNVAQVQAPASMTKSQGSSGAADPTSIGHGNHKLVLEDMIGAIEENRKPMVDGNEARNAVEVITALYRSSKEERIIML